MRIRLYELGVYEVFISEIASRVESGQAIATLGAKVGFKGKKRKHSIAMVSIFNEK